MPYDKNRGRAAGTPGFYRNVNKKRTHGENTGEWTREERARRQKDEHKGEFRPLKSRERYEPGEGYAPRQKGEHKGEFGPLKPREGYAPRGGALGRPARESYAPDERPGFGQRRPAHGTRNPALSADRPIYQDAFADEPAAPRPPMRAPARAHAPASAGAAERPAAQQPALEAEFAENIIVGRNPIREAIKSGRELERILVQRGELAGSAREIIARARERRIVVQEVDKARLDAIYPAHQGMIAYASAASYSSVEEILALAEERGEAPFIIALDGITDPHNLGAIIRTAECVGAHGVIFQQRRSVGLTPAAVKASAGAQEYMRVARVVNLTRTLADLKKRNIWVVGADMDGQKLRDTDLSGAIALVIGAEGEGISRLVRDECDLTVALPMRGHIQSLNASVAAGVLMYAVGAARGY